MMILHGGFFTSYFGLEGNCNVSTSMCPWQMQCVVTLHPLPCPSPTYSLHSASSPAHKMLILGSLEAFQPIQTLEHASVPRASIQELRVCINKLLLAHMADAIRFHNIQEINVGTFKTLMLAKGLSFKRTVYSLQTAGDFTPSWYENRTDSDLQDWRVKRLDRFISRAALQKFAPVPEVRQNAKCTAAMPQ